MNDLRESINRLRATLREAGDNSNLSRLETIVMQYEEADDRYRTIGGPGSREDLFTALGRINELCMATTGETLSMLTERLHQESPIRGSIQTGADEIGSAVVLCETSNGPKEFATGFVISATSGLVVTCHHFLRGRLSCLLHIQGTHQAADIVHSNADIDMAILRIREGRYLPVASVGRPAARTGLRSGETIRCFGRRQQGYLAERAANVANPSVQIRAHHVTVPVAELDATMHPGFSGAPAFSDLYELRGVVIARISEVGGIKESDVGLLLPIAHLLHWIDVLETEHGDGIWSR